ncbi:Protein of unknown function [Pyronema omphalodes CBS 100304]|uniref:Uncharacterized protein n=1 Tax=Pyronema omphalodes (strain CBS 100304) TaxID=1076935 RepID=U4L0K3_PYROM|nr:Protein of unknown function [Pyronema omphalodes CBS 100304]
MHGPFTKFEWHALSGFCFFHFNAHQTESRQVNSPLLHLISEALSPE